MFQVIYISSDKLKCINNDHPSPTGSGLGVTVFMLRHSHSQYCSGLGLQEKPQLMGNYRSLFSLFHVAGGEGVGSDQIQRTPFPL